MCGRKSGTEDYEGKRNREAPLGGKTTCVETPADGRANGLDIAVGTRQRQAVGGREMARLPRSLT